MTIRDYLQTQGAQFDASIPDRSAPAHFGNAAEEYAAARSSCVALWRDELGVVELRGGDRAKFLHNFCTQEIKALPAGGCCEAWVCNVKGRILAHLFVVAEADRLLLLTERTRVELLLQHLDRYLINEDVALADLSEHLSLVTLCGPASETILADALSCELPEEGAARHAAFGDSMLRVARWDAWKLPAVVLVVETNSFAESWSALVRAGAAPTGFHVGEALRIEACSPRVGIDVGDEHLAQEANRTSQTISFTKGCYLGQEPIARLDALGHVNRELAGVRFLSTTGVPAGTEIRSGSDGTLVGVVSSVARVPGGGDWAALAVLKRSASADGTSVTLIPASGEPIAGRVFRG